MGFLEGDSYPTLVHVLRRRAREQRDEVAFRYLAWSEAAEETARELTYGAIDREARAIAERLTREGARDEPVLLLYEPGLDFVTAFIGCLYAGAIAVPAYPPSGSPRHGLARLQSVLGDCAARFALLDGAAEAKLPEWRARAPELTALQWIRTDESPSLTDEPRFDPESDVGPDRLAFLQYTSGSTASPRGAMVSHGNVLHNLQSIRKALGGDPERDHGVFWLPQYHDMGLIGGLLLTVWSGSRSTILSPATFVKRPRVWLETIARTGATVSGGPNFAYDLCLRTISDHDLDDLDLSSWRIAFSGSEPVDAETCARFARRFEQCGFRATAFQPGYGMAENTLVVTSRPPESSLRTITLAAAALEEGRARPVPPGSRRRLRTVVSCGPPVPGHEVRVVDPESTLELLPLEVGEIWVRGASVARGYWRRTAETEFTFGGRLASGEGPFLRTGDLGFLHEGELYVTGRRKELLIFHGKKHYPLDIERTVLAADAKTTVCAAVSAKRDARDRLVLVCQSRGRLRFVERERAIRLAVAREHGLEVEDVVFVGSGQIPRTSSGKIQRRAVAARYAGGTIERLAPREPECPAPAATRETPPASEERDALVALLASEVAAKAGVPSSAVDVHAPFVSYGLSSVDAVRIAGVLEDHVGRALPPTLPFEYPTIDSLASYLASGEERARGDAAGPRAPESREGLAIVGMACRFPGARNLSELHALLKRGGDAVGPMPPGRAVDERAAPVAGYLDEVDRFAAEHFGIDASEAAAMDPQQRLLLELAWHALEDAGLPPRGLGGTATGVWVGISSADYALERFEDPKAHPHSHAAQAHSIASNRISYQLDLHGPSVSVDTACSSSLVALHLACEALRGGECELALVGGVNLLLAPSITERFERGGYMSPSGRCRAFDAVADGYVRGEGAAVVVLKPLSRALADRDRVYAVVRATACNQDGRTNGLTAPSRQAQEALLRRAYARAGFEPRSVSLVEAHGTGTPLGDPIEARALGAVLGRERDPATPCRIGSIKSNIGHLEAGAGIAGLVKTALSLYTRTLYPTCHFERPNPNIDLSGLGLRVQSACEPWPESLERLAGVSSFGFGGTNAHAVLAGAPEAPAAAPEANGVPVLLPLSAPTPSALHEQIDAMVALLRSAGAPRLDDLTFTASARRTHHRHRVAVVGRSAEELAAKLGDAAARLESSPARAERGARVAFVFGGQGGQWVGMGRDLFEAQPIFRAAYLQIAGAVEREADFSLLEAMDDPAAHERIDRVQPLLFALGVSLSQLLRALGVEPDVMIGQSMGEITAAAAAGVLSVEDGVRAIVRRSALLARLAGTGTMAMVDLSADAARERVGAGGASVAVHASPQSSVVAGEERAVRELCDSLEREGVGVRPIQVDVASHCHLVDPLREPLLERLASVRGRDGGVPVLSSVTCEPLAGADLDAAYLWRNLREPVRFAETVGKAIEGGARLFLEIGPHPVSSASAAQCLTASGVSDGVALATLRRGEDGVAALLELLGSLYERGTDVQWGAVQPVGRVIDLPQPPLPRSRHWTEPPRRRASSRGRPHPLLDLEVSSAAAPDARVFELSLSVSAFENLTQHRVAGLPVLSAGALLELAGAAASRVTESEGLELSDVRFERVLQVPAQGNRAVQIVVTPEEDGRRGTFGLHSRTGARTWARHLRGSYGPAGDRRSAEVPPPLSEKARHVSPATVYASLGERGLTYGASCQRVAQLRLDGDTCEAHIERHEDLEEDGYLLHPLLLDMCLQAIAPLVDRALRPESSVEGPGLLSRVARFRLLRRPEGPVAARASERSPGQFALTISDGRGVLAEAEGIDLLSDGGSARREPEVFRKRLEWVAAPLRSAPPVAGRWAVVASDAPFRDALAAGGEGTLVLEPPRTPTECEALTREIASRDVSGLLFCPECGIELAAFVRLVQRIGRSIPVWLVTRGAFSVLDGDVRAPEQAALLAVARAAWAEGVLEGGAVDLDAAPDDPAEELGFVWREVGASVDRCAIVARRAAERYLPRLKAASEPAKPARLDVHGGATYLVTGGLSDLGLHAARWLVTRGARHLLLCGRSEPGSPSVAARDEDLDALRAAGAAVRYLRLDVRDADAVARLAEELEAAPDLPPVGGVVHAAGVVELCPFEELTEERVARAFEPKARGADHLAKHFARRGSGFLLLYGSASASLGALARGLAPYAAANAYLEALASELDREGKNAVAIAWPPWQDIGRVRDAVAAGHFAAIGVATLAPAEADAVLDALDAPVTLLCALDRARYPSRGADGALLRDVDDGPAVSTPAKAAPVPYEAPRDALEARLASMWQEVLGVERVGRNDSFFALGGSSLKAATLLNRLRQHVTEEISIVALFEAPTIAHLSGYLRDHHPACAKAVERALAAESPIPRQERPRDLLARIDELSEEEVEALLSEQRTVDAR